MTISDEAAESALPEYAEFGKAIYDALYANRGEDWAVSTNLTLKVAQALIEQGWGKVS